MKYFKKYFFVFIILIFASSAKADSLGQNQAFFIDPQYDARSRDIVIATLRYFSDHAYFYIADDYWNNINQTVRNQTPDKVIALAREFDSRIYPIETQFFGSEPNPGIDNDPRITILITSLIDNAGGYFDTSHEFPRDATLNSNEREIIYLNIGEINNQSKMLAFLTHEFQHLISFNQKEKLRNVSDDIWLNELRSEYAVTMLGYNDNFEGSHLQRRLRAFISDPSDSLTEWRNQPPDYGQISLFGEYIAEHWSPQIIADTLKNNLVSIQSLNEALSRNNFSDTFLDVYRQWLIADILNDTSSNSKFGYTRSELSDFKITPTKTISNLEDNVAVVIADTIKDWQAKWYEISQFAEWQNNILKINFSSPSLASFNISYIVVKQDGNKQVFSFNPTPSSDTLYIPNIGGDTTKVIIITIKKDKLANFGSNEPTIRLTSTVERIKVLPEGASFFSPTPASIMPIIVSSPISTINQETPVSIVDGSLVRARGDYKVYVIKGHWRRHIIDSKIFSFYPGLGFNKVQEVDPSVLAQYQESNLVRYSGGTRVYVTGESGQRHWLNITPQKFAASGKSWDAVFIINLSELNFYKIGSNLNN